MTYAVVPSKATGDAAYSASEINAWIQANFAAGVPDVYSTKGQLAVATAQYTVGVAGAGTNGYLLHAKSANANNVSWRLPEYGFKGASNPASQTNGTENSATINNEYYDTEGLMGGSFNLTINATGYYLIYATVQKDSTAVSLDENESIYARLYNGATSLGVFAMNVGKASYTGAAVASGSTVGYFASGDNMIIKVCQNTGSTDTVSVLGASAFRIA